MSAFDFLPPESQPQRMDWLQYSAIEEWAYTNLKYLGEGKKYIKNLYIIPSDKVRYGNKRDTADMDILITPNPGWQDWIRKCLTIWPMGEIHNGGQWMILVQLPQPAVRQRVMLDFRVVSDEAWEYAKFFHSYGTILPAVLGSFARSLRYKHSMDGFYIRLKDLRHNYHNLLLTRNPKKMMRILMLDSEKITKELYRSWGVFEWITSSPRFDHIQWNRPNQPDGQTIVTKNRKSHAAIKKKPEAARCYEMIDRVVKSGQFDNSDYFLERIVLGDDYVDELLVKVNECIQRSRRVLDGSEIMEILGIDGGPLVGQYIQLLNNDPEFIDKSDEELKTLKVRERAIEILKEMHYV